MALRLSDANRGLRELMASIAETFWVELYERIVASPPFGIALSSIKREHRTNVTRQNSPAIHVIEGDENPDGKQNSCDWTWKMDGTIAVLLRDDSGLAAADEFVTEILKRINPDTAYSNGVRLELKSIGPNTEIADEDATRVDIEIRMSFVTAAWQRDAAGQS